VLGAVMLSGKAALINGDARDDARFSGLMVASRRQPRSSLSWPLAIKAQVIGVLSINRQDMLEPFTLADLQRGGPVVALLALVVDNWQMHADQ
ncbi:GAF domain-containing protein, partial [Roseateles sp. GG27B]